MSKLEEIKQQVLAAQAFEIGYIPYLEKLVFAQTKKDDLLRKELEKARHTVSLEREANQNEHI